MKIILFTANTSWYLYNFRKSTINAFIKNGFRVVCLSPEDSYSSKLVSNLNCEWYHLEMDNKGSNPFHDLKLLCGMQRHISRINPDIIFNFTIKNNIYGTWAATISGVSVVNNVSGLGTAFINNNVTSKIVKLLYRLSQPFATKVFCQNPEDFELLVSEKLVDRRKLQLLPGSGVDTRKFSPTTRVSRNDRDRFKFVFIGRMIGDKGIYELIDATEKLREYRQDFELELCGFSDSENASALSAEQLSQLSRKDYINWIGSSDSIEQVYANADCVVLPSYREGMPRTLLEAGAMGLPSITTDVPGCRNVITHEFNGLLCDVKSASSLFEQMLTMLNMGEEHYDLLSRNSRQRIIDEFDEKFVIESALETVSEIFSK
ncbi:MULTISPECIES: glycosyltransferase family 4 protein [unclassified Vibrio]|uniref:glycosyltransferase family 4 protein n=1 Tax=unclassified Vibrio TaxID=2614977 RepID=UPI00188244E0|nr:glycosyltransferase family 4 protein [Vibrio sp. OPT24]MBE8557263.1 glycosyltransferase family 4 protein [Vibrio sp. OPT24]